MHSRLKNTQQRGRVLSGRDGPESVVEKRRNWWSRWTGIGGRDQTDSVVAMDRITQLWLSSFGAKCHHAVFVDH